MENTFTYILVSLSPLCLSSSLSFPFGLFFSPAPSLIITISCGVSVPGLLWQLRPSDVEVELLAHTRQVISHDLEQETGLETGWIQNGGLFIASNKQRLDEYKRLMSVRSYRTRLHWTGVLG